MTDHQGLRDAMGVEPSGVDEIQQLLDEAKRAVVEAEDGKREHGFQCFCIGVVVGFVLLGIVLFICS